MIAIQQETQETVTRSMVLGVAEAIAERQGDTPAQRSARSREVVHSIMGFQPRDVVEIMFAGMVVTHAHLVQDSACDALRGQEDRLKARTKSTAVALGRGMLGFLRELRLAQTRVLVVGDAVADGTPAVAGEPDAAPPDALAGTEAKPTSVAAKPEIPRAPRASYQPPARTAAAKPPAPLLPPARRTETSVAAMLTALSPPTAPRLGRLADAKPAPAGPAAAGIGQIVPRVGADLAGSERPASPVDSATAPDRVATAADFAVVAG